LEIQLDLGLSAEAKMVAIEQVKEKAARDILTKIENWRTTRVSTARRRWPFELLQNAIDTAKARKQDNLKVSFQFDGKRLVFRHNAGQFSLKEAGALIYGGSTKPYDPDSEYLGRFGSGFIVSHIVSRDVRVSGSLRSIKGDSFRFQIPIDRQGETQEKIAESIENAFLSLDKSSREVEQNENWTEYVFDHINSEGSEAAEVGLAQLRENLPFVFAFNNIQDVTIGLDHYSKNVEAHGNLRTTTVGDTSAYWMSSSEEPVVNVGVLVKADKILDLDKRPTIFVGLPITESADYARIPFVMNCDKFETDSERDALKFDAKNEELLTIGFGLFERVVVEVVSSNTGTGDTFRLAQFVLVPETQTDQVPILKRFNTGLLEMFHRIVTEIPLVATIRGKETISKSIFPTQKIGEAIMDSDIFAQYYDVVRALGKTIPNKEVVENWVGVAAELKRHFDKDVTIYSLVDVRDELDELVNLHETYPSFEDLGQKYGLPHPEELLLNLFRLINRIYSDGNLSSDFVQDILPNQQNRIGPVNRTLASHKTQLSLEDPPKSIPNDLKELVTQIGLPIREVLIHENFSEFKIVGDYVHGRYSVEKTLKDVISDSSYDLPASVSDWDDERVVGWMGLFHWCLLAHQLVSGFPLIMKDSSVKKLVEFEQPVVLLPFKMIGLDVQFEDIYPENRFLSTKYFKVPEQNLLESFANYRSFVTSLPLHTDEYSFPFEKLETVLDGKEELSRVDHRLTSAERAISLLPFWQEIIGRISDSKDRAALLFRFALTVLAPNDSAWKTSVRLSCTCNAKAHSLFPSHWLASLKHDAWIPVETEDPDNNKKIVHVSVAKGNIERLFSKTDFDLMIGKGPDLASEFLPHFAYDKLDLVVKIHSLTTGQPEQVLRDNLSSLVALSSSLGISVLKELSQDPGAFNELVGDIKRRIADQKLKDENTTIGLAIQKIMTKMLAEKGIPVKPIEVGGDLELWPNPGEGSDHGEVRLGTVTMEVKSTGGSRVHLSKAQSEKAAEQKATYVVLVVGDTGDLRKQILALKPDDEVSAELMTALLSRSHVVENLHSKLGDIPHTEEIEADIKGYWIKDRLWMLGPGLEQWSQSALASQSL
jgi:hypothetical protein